MTVGHKLLAGSTAKCNKYMHYILVDTLTLP
jgi:hypothetical protein